MELTPELFEKTEFTERRKGYDIEQVETFLEQTGTALAQLLARTRHTEERAAHAEARLAQADAAIAEARQRAQAAEQRIEQAEQAARDAGQQVAAGVRANEEAEVEQAAKTLLMAKRTAEATVNEARGQAQALLEDSQNRAQRQLSEANAEAAELIRRANEQAEAEFADRRAAVLDEVRGLEARRAQLADVITQLDSRLAGYREELTRSAEELVALADDPSRLGARPNMSILPDEVLPSGGHAETDPGDGADPVAPVIDPDAPAPTASTAPTPTPSDAAPADAAPVGDPSSAADGAPSTSAAEDAPAAPTAGPAPAAAPEASQAAAPMSSTATITIDPEDDADAPYVDLTGQVAAPETGGSEWGPGSWSQVEAQLVDDEPSDHIDRPTEAVAPADAPRDRFMEELDSAVNEAVNLEDEDAAMTAFFEGSGDSRTRRFGWRR